MELNDTQKRIISEWAAEGCTLSEIQKHVNEEFNLSLTFMDVRMLLLDLDIKLKDQPTAKSTEDPGNLAAEDTIGGTAPAGIPGQVSVEVDKLQKPGALVNGTVTFSDGVSASWFLDQSGRLGLNPDQQNYRPSESDLKAFQEELSRQIQSRGF